MTDAQPDGPRGPAQRLTRHLRLAIRASRASILLATAGGIVLPLLLPVTQAWLVATVAILAGVIAVALTASDRGAPADVADVEAALERAGTPGLLAHALLRAAFVLAALAVGLALGGLLPNAQPS